MHMSIIWTEPEMGPRSTNAERKVETNESFSVTRASMEAGYKGP